MIIKLKNILNEINLFSRDDIIKELTRILKAKNINDQDIIARWFLNNYIKWFISPQNDDEKRSNVSKHIANSEDPDWARKPDIMDFKDFSDDQINEINHIIDFFQTLPKNKLSKIEKTPFPVVRELIKKWDLLMKRRMQNQNMR